MSLRPLGRRLAEALIYFAPVRCAELGRQLSEWEMRDDVPHDRVAAHRSVLWGELCTKLRRGVLVATGTWNGPNGPERRDIDPELCALGTPDFDRVTLTVGKDVFYEVRIAVRDEEMPMLVATVAGEQRISPRQRRAQLMHEAAEKKEGWLWTSDEARREAVKLFPEHEKLFSEVKERELQASWSAAKSMRRRH